MRYTEELLWILDKEDRKSIFDPDKYRENIDFVHSLGLKCDSVGWCKLDLLNPETPAIFEKISDYCREKKWTARCIYTRKYAEEESEWYELCPVLLNDMDGAKHKELHSGNGEPCSLWEIKAYRERIAAPKVMWKTYFVPDRFRDACMQFNPEIFDFVWAKDTGKYAAEQYFNLYGKHLIPHVAVQTGNNDDIIKSIGGMLPEVAKTFHKIQIIDLPHCYLKEDLPNEGAAYAALYKEYPYFTAEPDGEDGTYRYIHHVKRDLTQHTILIHKDLARYLIEKRAVSSKYLVPVPVVDKLPPGYILEETEPISRPMKESSEKRESEYKNIISADRPIYLISEKESLKCLRNAKKERKEDFQKALPKKKSQELSETSYAPLLPYYMVADGACLSDEYELFSYEYAFLRQEEFYYELNKEELLSKKPEGIVFAGCADGDSVLLCKDNSVIRWSHEEPVEVDKWDSLAQFIFEAINSW